MRNRRLAALICLILLAGTLAVSASAVEVDGMHVYTFWGPSATTFYPFTNYAETTDQLNPLFIKVNIMLPEGLSGNYDFLIAVRRSDAGAVYLRSAEVLNSNYAVVSTSTSFAGTSSGVQISGVKIDSVSKFLSLVLEVSDPVYSGHQSGEYIGPAYFFQVTGVTYATATTDEEVASGLAAKLLNGIKSLFVPSDAEVQQMFDRWEQLFSDRFGAIYDCFNMIMDYASQFNYSGAQGQLTFPTVDFEFSGVPWSFGGWTVTIIPPGFETPVFALKKIISIAATFAFLGGMKKRLEEILGGGGHD